MSDIVLGFVMVVIRVLGWGLIELMKLKALLGIFELE